jgi:uncharacterized membrane protein
MHVLAGAVVFLGGAILVAAATVAHAVKPMDNTSGIVMIAGIVVGIFGLVQMAVRGRDSHQPGVGER